MKKFWSLVPVVILLTASLVVVTIMTLFLNQNVFFACLSITLVCIAYTLIRLLSFRKDTYFFLQRMAGTLPASQKDALMKFPMPAFVANETGAFLWYNDLFRDNVLEGVDVLGQSVSKVIKGLTVDTPDSGVPSPAGADVSFNGRMYSVFSTDVVNEQNTMKIYYFVDNTELKMNSIEYFESRPSVLLVMIDNIEDLVQNARESEKAELTGSIDRILEGFVAETSGFMRKIDRNRFIMVIEERHIKRIIENKFEILDKVRAITISNNSNPIQATLSIGVGRGSKDLRKNEEMARQALDMALGRGGDQAAVKTPSGYEFYGGVSKCVEKRTKVKTRIVATALMELFESADNVLVMGHRNADLDALGSAIGMSCAVRHLGKDSFVVINPETNLAAPLYDRLCEKGYDSLFLRPEEALEHVTKRTMLIVVDTHVARLVESKELYEQCKTVVVIDHHRKMPGYIDNAVIFYHEPYASSAAEMVTELIQYFGEKCHISRYEAEALLSGIMLDTKNFVLKAGVRTFEAAAYLKRMGADTVEVKKLFSNNMESYLRRAYLVSEAEVYKGCAIAVTDRVSEDIRIVASQAADELLSINNVIASFVMYETDTEVCLSCRSLGEINVQLIAERLGGGGHLTMSAAQFKNITLDEAKTKLYEAIDFYYETHTEQLVPAAN